MRNFLAGLERKIREFLAVRKKGFVIALAVVVGIGFITVVWFATFASVRNAQDSNVVVSADLAKKAAKCSPPESQRCLRLQEEIVLGPIRPVELPFLRKTRWQEFVEVNTLARVFDSVPRALWGAIWAALGLIAVFGTAGIIFGMFSKALSWGQGLSLGLIAIWELFQTASMRGKNLGDGLKKVKEHYDEEIKKGNKEQVGAKAAAQQQQGGQK